MKGKYCILGWQKCGCLGTATWIDDGPDEKRTIAKANKVIEKRGYRKEIKEDLEKSMQWECSEHRSLRLRLISEELQEKRSCND